MRSRGAEKAFQGAAVKWTLLVDDVPVGLLANGTMLACPLATVKHKIGVSVYGSRPAPVEIEMPAAAHLMLRIAPQFKKGMEITEKKELSQDEFDALHLPKIETADGTPRRMIVSSHAGRVLAAGLGAWIFGILGFFALGRGMQDLQQMKQGEMTTAGKSLIIFGMISGGLGFLVNVGFLISRCSSGNL
jgi:hypothetical protein